MEPILKIRNLSKAFGGLMALRNIDLQAQPGQIVGIIGPNGAGKTTLFNCLSSLYHPSEGRIVFQGRQIVPELSGRKARVIRRCALVSLILSLFWAPLFWLFFLPETIFKIELTLLTIFILSIRLLVLRRLKQFQVWAWGIMFAALSADLYLAIWWLSHVPSLGSFRGTEVSLAYAAIPWSILVVPFNLYFIWELLQRETRQLYGFWLGPDAISRLGVARTFQNIRLFYNLSVLDNVKIGTHGQMQAGLWGTLARTASQRNEEALTEKQAIEQLHFVGLQSRAFDLAGALAYGEQRRLEIARALASNPQLLLLDEPAAGMNPQESSQLIKLIFKIRDKGITILIIEHDMRVMMNLAEYIYVLDYGGLIGHGTPDEIRANTRVIEAYLGGGGAHAKT
jgi:branched-chain amino acid transport system ATP-binding protein